MSIQGIKTIQAPPAESRTFVKRATDWIKAHKLAIAIVASLGTIAIGVGILYAYRQGYFSNRVQQLSPSMPPAVEPALPPAVPPAIEPELPPVVPPSGGETPAPGLGDQPVVQPSADPVVPPAVPPSGGETPAPVVDQPVVQPSTDPVVPTALKDSVPVQGASTWQKAGKVAAACFKPVGWVANIAWDNKGKIAVVAGAALAVYLGCRAVKGWMPVSNAHALRAANRLAEDVERGIGEVGREVAHLGREHRQGLANLEQGVQVVAQNVAGVRGDLAALAGTANAGMAQIEGGLGLLIEAAAVTGQQAGMDPRLIENLRDLGPQLRERAAASAAHAAAWEARHLARVAAIAHAPAGPAPLRAIAASAPVVARAIAGAPAPADVAELARQVATKRRWFIPELFPVAERGAVRAIAAPAPVAPTPLADSLARFFQVEPARARAAIGAGAAIGAVVPLITAAAAATARRA